MILLVSLGAFAVVASVAGLVVRSASDTTANNTAPALVGVQDLFASVAEANAAATAAFLASEATGVEDRADRNLYLEALGRAAAQTEEVSATIGSDGSAHEALQDINESLVAYAGRVEVARIESLNDLPGAERDLRLALELVQGDVETAVDTVTLRGQAQLDSERDSGQTLTWIAMATGVLTLIGLLWVQYQLLRRTNRILNPLLVLATLLVGGVVGYLYLGSTARNQLLDEASTGGYDAIDTTSDIQTSVFELQSQLSLKILDRDQVDAELRYDDVEAGIANLIAGAAADDSDRELAAATTVQIRWSNYRAVAEEIESALDAGDSQRAIELYQGEGQASFNGINTAIESALLDNRQQFLTGVDQAARAVEFTPFLTIILPVLAALATMLAIQRRLGEYR